MAMTSWPSPHMSVGFTTPAAAADASPSSDGRRDVSAGDSAVSVVMEGDREGEGEEAGREGEAEAEREEGGGSTSCCFIRREAISLPAGPAVEEEGEEEEEEGSR